LGRFRQAEEAVRVGEQVMLTGWTASGEDFPFEAEVGRSAVAHLLSGRAARSAGTFEHYAISDEEARPLVEATGISWPDDEPQWQIVVQPLFLR
jgi:hypothetical protein